MTAETILLMRNHNMQKCEGIHAELRAFHAHCKHCKDRDELMERLKDFQMAFQIWAESYRSALADEDALKRAAFQRYYDAITSDYLHHD